MLASPRATSSAAPPDSPPSFWGQLIRFTRFHEWHPGKLPLLLGFALTLRLGTPAPPGGALWVAVSYGLASLYLAFAYMVNNLADADQDRLANKAVGLVGHSPSAAAFAVLVAAALGLGIGLAVLQPAAAGMMIGCYLLAWVYSFPPRLKEHVVLGPLVAAWAQVPAPALVLAAAWGSLPPAAIAYGVVALLYGLRMILVHQLVDHGNDRLTSTRTTATTIGVHATRRVVRLTFGLELVATAVLVALLAGLRLPAVLLAGLAWPLVLAIVRWRRGERVRLDTYAYIPLAEVHESQLPLILAAAVALGDGAAMMGASLLVVLPFLSRHLERLVWPLTRWERTRD